MTRKGSAPDIRTAALADLAAGESPQVVAERYHLDPGKVRVWKQRHVTGSVAPRVTSGVTQHQAAQIAQQRQMGELILDLLRAKLEASEAIARAVADPVWLAKQSATELADLGQFLDASAFAIGDRLAGRSARSDDIAATDSE